MSPSQVIPKEVGSWQSVLIIIILREHAVRLHPDVDVFLMIPVGLSSLWLLTPLVSSIEQPPDLAEFVDAFLLVDPCDDAARGGERAALGVQSFLKSLVDAFADYLASLELNDELGLHADVAQVEEDAALDHFPGQVVVLVQQHEDVALVGVDPHQAVVQEVLEVLGVEVARPNVVALQLELHVDPGHHELAVDVTRKRVYAVLSLSHVCELYLDLQI